MTSLDCAYCDGTGTAPLDGYPVTCLHCHGTGVEVAIYLQNSGVLRKGIEVHYVSEES